MEVEYKFLCPDELNYKKTMEIIDAFNEDENVCIVSTAFEDVGTKYLDSATGSLRKSNIAVRDRYEGSDILYFVGVDPDEDEAQLDEFEEIFGREYREEIERCAKDELIREERHILSFKWGGSAEQGLHRRHEVDVDLTNDTVEFWRLNRNIYRKFRKAEEEGLVGLFTTMIRRVKIYALVNESMIEVCIDAGFFMKDEGKIPEVDKGILKIAKTNDPKEEVGIIELIPKLPESHVISEIELELNQGSEEDLKALADFLSDKFNLIPNEVSKYQRGLNLYDEELAASV